MTALFGTIGVFYGSAYSGGFHVPQLDLRHLRHHR